MLDPKALEWEWVRNLAQSENNTEVLGEFDPGQVFNLKEWVMKESLNFLNDLKNLFQQAVLIFNEQKTSPAGKIKIYGIARTYADFMLFRNGYKMIFSLKEPGVIAIRFNFWTPSNGSITASNLQNQGNRTDSAGLPWEETVIQAQVSPFGDIRWTYQNHEVSLKSIVRYHFALFVKESLG